MDQDQCLSCFLTLYLKCPSRNFGRSFSFLCSSYLELTARLDTFPFSYVFWQKNNKTVIHSSYNICCLIPWLKSQFATVEVMITSLKDGYPGFIEKKLKRHEVLVLLVCLVSFIVGIPYIFEVITILAQKFISKQINPNLLHIFI